MPRSAPPVDLEQTPSPQEDVDAAVQNMIGLSDALLQLIDRENRHLAESMPVPLGDIAERKHELVDELRKSVGNADMQNAALATASPELAEALRQRGAELTEALQENGERLRKAIATSHHRVETIMRAIREDVNRPSAYGGNGRYENASYSARPVSLRPGVEA
ncbi:flagellar export chaperone FlgN [Breoghania sp.]|uniref:flagellar export chaperone FlgN n=1 Tax=Breoghania sp. TaxID=2065378 RepID=UPI0026103502|nr:flagellar export chaperone FlgN [Breoghania sp.]MDJ0932520.1 flagellar export chaperone FlgN [Breoghania sp.]